MSVRQQPPGPPTIQGHPSRRDNQSVSSMASARGSTSSSSSNANPAVESAVTRLLVAIKQLLEALTLWSTTKMDEGQVSDVYVRLGNDFNAAVAAFSAFNIDMAELLNVPEELRSVLEQCLAEDATPENLEIYLPTVRQIITSLLQGLRGKQSLYRRIISDQKRGSSSSDVTGPPRTSSRTSRSEKVSRGDGSRTHRSQLSRTINEDGTSGSGDDNSMSRRSRQSSGRQRELSTQPTGPSDEEAFTPPAIHASLHPSTSAPNRSSQSMVPHPPHRAASVSTADEPVRGPSRTTTPVPPTEYLPPLPSSPPPPPQVPAHVKRYSLVDGPPTSPPAVVIDEPSEDYINHRVRSPSPPETPPLDNIAAPGMANSLAALQKSDALERRASKRFSTYNISKMTGGPSTVRERSIRSNHPNRRSLAASNTLTPGELNVLTEEDEEEVSSPVQANRERSSSRPPVHVELEQKPTLQDRIPPPGPARTPSSEKIPEYIITNGDEAPPPSTPAAFPVFLQLGREVKKATIEPGLSFSSLRVLFVDKFSYNPGLENFPAIYIRDPSSGVQYELEDMDEVKQKCLLSLNIEPLDQIKQHIDSQISGLSNDIKDLKTVVATSSRQAPAPIIAQGFAEDMPSLARPSDRQLHTVARRLSRMVGNGSPMQQMQPQMTGQSVQSQMTGGSVLSEYSSRVMADLRTQFDEVQNLRRDLGIMRQLYTDFMKNTKESLGTLRTQTQSVKQLATANVGGARGYIDSGKTNLDTRSQNILTKVEILQDTVENVKEDVIKRHITPKPHLFKAIKADIDKAAAELESLKEHIKTIKPMWKKTWEEELQNIVEEQQFLNHQEEFLGDLFEDHKAVLEVYGHVEKIISIRGTGPVRLRKAGGFKPPPPDEGHTGLSTVMLEIRGASVDSEQRLKAIAANQKNREKDLATRSDEFQDELTGFVGGKKLKMTGGAEETERVRKLRDEMTLKAMFNVNTGPPGSAESSQPSPTSPSEFYDAAS